MERELTTDELMFFTAQPRMLLVYEALRARLFAAWPQTLLKVGKTQLSFYNRHLFTMASTPRRKRTGWPEEFLLVSFGLGRAAASPRIAEAVEAYPGRWTHHVPVECAEEIDAELMHWLEEAWQFAQTK